MEELKQLKERIRNLGAFDSVYPVQWTGYIGLYLTARELMLLKKAGIDYEKMSIKEIYEAL